MGCSPVFLFPSFANNIIMDSFINVQHYLQIVVPHGIPEKDRPKICLVCGQYHVLIYRHGKFDRVVFVLDEPDGIEIPIFRFYCRLCEHSFSIIPSFVEKHHQMALDIKEEVIKKHEEGVSLPEVAKTTIALPGGAFSEKTLWRWTRHWNDRLRKLEDEIWSWLISRLPYICLPTSVIKSLWLILFDLWPKVRQKLPDWRDIHLLHFLNRLT